MSNRPKLRQPAARRAATVPATATGAEPSPPVTADDLPASIAVRVRQAVLANGMQYEPTGDGGLPRQPARLCMISAARLALKHPHLTYCEGVALIYGTWQHHAWLVGPDGGAIEAVWPEPGDQYVGIPFADREVTRALRGARHTFRGMLLAPGQASVTAS